MWWSGNTFTANQYSQIAITGTISTGANEFAGPSVRHQSGSDSYYVFYMENGNALSGIWIVNSGSTGGQLCAASPNTDRGGIDFDRVPQRLSRRFLQRQHLRERESRRRLLPHGSRRRRHHQLPGRKYLRSTMRKIALASLVLILAAPLLGQQAAPTVPYTYTDSLIGAGDVAGAMNSSWDAVVGPAESVAAMQDAGLAIAAPSTYGVESFNVPLLPGPQAIQAAITWVDGNYPAIVLDQDPTGGSIALEPSVTTGGSVYSLVANSGNYPGQRLCIGALPISSGDSFKLSKVPADVGYTYTATDVTTGKVICSTTNALHQGVPGLQVDDRVGISSIGPVTVTGLVPAPPPPITLQVPPGSAHVLTLQIDPGERAADDVNWVGLGIGLYDFPKSGANRGYVGGGVDLTLDGAPLVCTYSDGGQVNNVFTLSCTVPVATP
jgi:hypothetical protein